MWIFLNLFDLRWEIRINITSKLLTITPLFFQVGQIPHVTLRRSSIRLLPWEIVIQHLLTRQPPFISAPNQTIKVIKDTWFAAGRGWWTPHTTASPKSWMHLALKLEVSFCYQPAVNNSGWWCFTKLLSYRVKNRDGAVTKVNICSGLRPLSDQTGHAILTLQRVYVLLLMTHTAVVSSSRSSSQGLQQPHLVFTMT